MACWNGLSASQQARLVNVGNLPIGYQPHGPCKAPAAVCVESEADAAPGPRFYCWDCAVAYVTELRQAQTKAPTEVGAPSLLEGR